MSKIEYQYIPVTSQAEPAPKSDRLPGISYHARAALLIGICAAGIIFTIGWIFNQSWWKGSLVTGFLSGCIYGIIWVYWSATHEQRMATAELKRKWKQEDADKYGYESPAEEYEFTEPRQLQLTCLQILDIHYRKGREATRPECEKIGISQTDWNEANRLLQAIEIKGDRSWQVTDAKEAFDRLEHLARFDKDAVWVRPTPQSANWVRF